ncbi:response regulator [Acuticoccus sp.]|uniref:response regulator n=1 Tax=Acuticoccus sp. TaxID=1904378 RepID=UPI003B51C666
MALEDMLEDLGHHVVGVAAAVERAIAMIEHMAADVDAAIVDANLSGVSARPVVDKLTECGVPVLVASGYEPKELRRLGFTTAILRKPYRPQELQLALVAEVGRS